MSERKLRREGLENQVKGAKDEAIGNLKGDVGDAVDDHDTHLRGRAQQAKGKVQRKIGEVQERIADEASEARDDRDRNERDRNV